MASNYARPSPGPSKGLCAHPLIDAKEAAGESFKVGAPVELVAGLLAECADAADAATNQVGWAASNASGTTSAQCAYYPLEVPMEFSANDESAGGDLAQADIGALFDLVKDATTGYWFVDLDLSASDNVKITEAVDAVGTAYARVIVESNAP